MALRLLVVLVFATSLALPAQAGPARRADWGEAIGATLCPTSGNRQPATADARVAAWSAGLYDAQIEGRYLEKLGSRTVGKAEAEDKAKALASVKRFGSYAFGTCDNGDAWALAFPGPSPIVKIDRQGRWRLPAAALAARCASFRVDAVKSDGGMPIELTVKGDAVDTSKIVAGTVSVTCQPKAPRWQGPVVWYLAPVGAGPLAVVPEADALGTTGDAALTLATWIGRLRAKEGLSPLESTPALADQAVTLAVDGSLTHDRQMLAKASARLKEGEIRFLGEDRVKGVDALQMAWLLWNSPRHRGLLLNKAATSIGIGLRGLGTEQLAVIVVGAKTPLTTAAGTPAKKGG